MRVSLTVTAKVQLLAAAEDCWDEVAFIGCYLRALHDKRNGKFELVRYTKAGLVRYVKKDEKGEHFILSPTENIHAAYYRRGNHHAVELIFYDFQFL